MKCGPVLVAHPSPDLYGSDLQLLETVDALRAAGHDILAVLPLDGPLVPFLRDRGASVQIMAFPVLRKSSLSLRGVMQVGAQTAMATVRAHKLIRRVGAKAVLVNTVTLPSWLAAGRLSGRPVISHVHEAEEHQPIMIRLLLAGQLLMAHCVVVNSAAAARALTSILPRLSHRITVVHNGVPCPPDPPSPLRRRQPGDPLKAVLVGRLSPRKGIDVALEAIARLRTEGHDVTLSICGTPFPGYEWYADQLFERAQQSDLRGSVAFLGYVFPTWPVLAEADVVLVPSRAEPFGNVAVEALHAGRPVVASAVQGLKEIIRHGVTGVLARPDDAHDLAASLTWIFDNPTEAAHLATAGQRDAASRFTPSRYATAINNAVAPHLQRSKSRRPGSLASD